MIRLYTQKMQRNGLSLLNNLAKQWDERNTHHCPAFFSNSASHQKLHTHPWTEKEHASTHHLLKATVLNPWTKLSFNEVLLHKYIFLKFCFGNINKCEWKPMESSFSASRDQAWTSWVTNSCCWIWKLEEDELAKKKSNQAGAGLSGPIAQKQDLGIYGSEPGRGWAKTCRASSVNSDLGKLGAMTER